jgi:redox-sensing transcriptional repressor
VADLAATLQHILGLSRTWRVGLVGVGKIGSALLGYRDLARRGFKVVAAFDVEPDKIGREIFGVRVAPLSDLARVVREEGVEIAIVATPPDAAADVAKRLAAAGVGAILNFAPTEIQRLGDVPVRTVDVVLELEGLSYLLSGGRRQEPE